MFVAAGELVVEYSRVNPNYSSMDGPIPLKVFQCRSLLFLVSFITIFLIVPSASAQNTPPDVINVTLDKEVVYARCYLKIKTPGNEECPENGARVKVSASAQDRENNPLIYLYNVTGGRIVGQGSNVFWDLTKERAGEYSITVSADDGGGTKGKQITKTIKLEECPHCDPGCECPSIDIRPTTRFVLPGERIGFEALVTGEQQGITYNWTASNGQIENGQGTPSISVRSDKSAIGRYLYVKLEIGGTNPGCNCPSTVEESIFIGKQGSEKKSPSEITRLELDRTELYLACNPQIKVVRYTCPVGGVVEVSARMNNKNGRKTNIRYEVSGGKIIGEGPNVKWDLGGAAPGTYTISANVNDSGKVTKSVTVRQCPDCTAECLVCPELEMNGPATELEYGQIYTVGADIRGWPQDELTIKWTISTGEIIDGQGTPMLRFRIPRQAQEKEITITYDIGELDPLCALCPTIFSQTLIIPRDGYPKRVPDSLVLDQTEIVQRPPPGCKSASGDCEKGSIIDVRTVRSGVMFKNFEYKYSVSAGKVFGSGAQVKWDLSDVKPGTYNIAVTVKGLGEQTVESLQAKATVRDCPDCICDFDCPSVSVAAPYEVEAGKTAVFTANISGGSLDTVTYDWTVSNGEIINGQGTPSITVATVRKMAGNKITATVKIPDNSPAHVCPNTPSATARIVTGTKP